MLGGACAALGDQPVAPFVVVGVAAVFAGALHVPIATMMMVTEMAGGYTLLVPAALAPELSRADAALGAFSVSEHLRCAGAIARRFTSPLCTTTRDRVAHPARGGAVEFGPGRVGSRLARSFGNSRTVERDSPSAYKTITDRRTDKLVGAHLLGTHADEIHQFVRACDSARSTRRQIKQAIYSYPTSSSDLPYML
jgi:hypothetical protein